MEVYREGAFAEEPWEGPITHCHLTDENGVLRDDLPARSRSEPRKLHLLPPNLDICSLYHAICWLGKVSPQGGPPSATAPYHLHTSSLAIITHLCLRNINHPLAASQINVRGNKELPPLIPLSGLDCKAQPYGETQGSSPSRFPIRPQGAWLGRPTLLAASAPSDPASGLPLFLSEPAAWVGLMSVIPP